MARLTCSVRVVQLRIESRLWMEKLEDQLMSASGKLQRGMRWPVKVRKGPKAVFNMKKSLRQVSASDDASDLELYKKDKYYLVIPIPDYEMIEKRQFEKRPNQSVNTT